MASQHGSILLISRRHPHLDRSGRSKRLTTLLSFAFLGVVSMFPLNWCQVNPHLPWNQTWLIVNAETGTIANFTTSNKEPRDTWFPDLYVDLCDLVGEKWDPSDQEPFPFYGCGTPGQRAHTRGTPFYVCPGHSRSWSQVKKCGGPEAAYCASWGCESTGHISWTAPVTTDLITVQMGNLAHPARGMCPGRQDCGSCYDKNKHPTTQYATPGGRCNPLIIKFTSTGKKADWTTEKTWGLRLYRSGYDPTLIFTIRHILNPIIKPVGPNLVINPQPAPPKKLEPTLAPTPPT